MGNRCFNLFTKDDVRSALADEACPGWPKMAGIIRPILTSRRGERLTGATASPNKSTIIPFCEPECTAPPSDAGEEVALGVLGQIGGPDFGDTSFIDISVSYETRLNQFA
jgi:hypothetical protein